MCMYMSICIHMYGFMCVTVEGVGSKVAKTSNGMMYILLRKFAYLKLRSI